MIYDSGIVEIYSVPSFGNGDLPSTQGVLKGKQYFGTRTLGFNRYYTAKANQDRIDKVIECWTIPEVDTSDYAVIGGQRFRIVMVQYSTNDDGLPIMVLSLEVQNDEN